MRFNTATITAFCVSVGSASAFSTTATTSVAFVGRTGSSIIGSSHVAGCACPACTSFHPSGCVCVACSRAHAALCLCASCTGRSGTALFVSAEDVEAAPEADVEVPPEVEAMDGVESEEEAHNVERPARSTLKKKKAKGKDLSEFTVGSTVTGSVRTITNYGAFIDIGATTDGLLHISQLSSGYVASVGDVLKEGQQVDVRIVSIDSGKGQVALSLMTEAEEAAGVESAKQQRDRPPRRQQRRDDSAVLNSLAEKGWDSSAFVEGTVVSTVDFGCFVRVDASLLNSECEGSLDGLVHISALRSGRVNSVSDVVSVDDKVKVRVKGINGSKVSLTMLSAEDEDTKAEERGGTPASVSDGASDWKESLEKFEAELPTFKNGPVIQDRRK